MYCMGLSLMDLGTISSGVYRWVGDFWAYVSEALFPFIEENRERSSQTQRTEGCEWENGPSVTLRWSIFTRRTGASNRSWVSIVFLFWLVTRFVCTLDYCTCWLTDKRRQWKRTGLGQRPGISSESIAGRPTGRPGVETRSASAHHLHLDELLTWGLIGGSSNWFQ